MALTRNDKEQLLAEYQGGLAKAPHAFLIGYQGITVPQVTELRNKVRASGGEYVVVKNTLALRAIDSQALDQLKEHFVGPTAVVFSQTDPVALAGARRPRRRRICRSDRRTAELGRIPERNGAAARRRADATADGRDRSAGRERRRRELSCLDRDAMHSRRSS